LNSSSKEQKKASDGMLVYQDQSSLLGFNQTQKIMMDSAQSPQPQIRVRKEPFKPQNAPSNLTKYEENLLKKYPQDDG